MGGDRGVEGGNHGYGQDGGAARVKQAKRHDAQRTITVMHNCYLASDQRFFPLLEKRQLFIGVRCHCSAGSLNDDIAFRSTSPPFPSLPFVPALHVCARVLPVRARVLHVFRVCFACACACFACVRACLACLRECCMCFACFRCALKVAHVFRMCARVFGVLARLLHVLRVFSMCA